jgi:tetratricopeptide (TPR) repeat protein
MSKAEIESPVSEAKEKTIFNTAVDFQTHGDAGEAEKYYRLLLKSDSSDWQAIAYYGLGTLERNNNNNEAALSYFNTSLKIKPRAEAYLERGFYYLDESKCAALADFTEAIKLQPDMSDSYIWRGYIYSEQKKYLEALSDLNEGLTKNPKDSRGFLFRANIYKEQGQHSLAIADYFHALHHNLFSNYKVTIKSEVMKHVFNECSVHLNEYSDEQIVAVIKCLPKDEAMEVLANCLVNVASSLHQWLKLRDEKPLHFLSSFFYRKSVSFKLDEELEKLEKQFKDKALEDKQRTPKNNKLFGVIRFSEQEKMRKKFNEDFNDFEVKNN